MQEYEIRITTHAEESLREIGAYIWEELMVPETAINLLQTIRQEIKKLSYMPSKIHLTPEEPWRSYGVRRMRVKNFYVYFWIDEENLRVQVTDVIYVARDQKKQLETMPID